MAPSPHNSATGVWWLFLAAGAVGYRLGTDDIDMFTTFPGWTDQRSKLPPREIFFSGGDLSVVNENGDTAVLTGVPFAGVRLPISVVTINAASTATQLLVMW